MSRNYTGLGRYEQLFDQLDAAISRLESRCDKIERRVTNLQASKATYVQQPYACYVSRRKLRTSPLPEPPPQPAQDLRYYSRPCWDPPSHRQQFGRAAYEPLPARRMSHNTCVYNPPTCWETQGQCTFHEYSAYGQPTYTNMDSSYVPPRQYTTSNFRQPPNSSDESPRKPYTGSHPGQHEDQPTPPPYRPPHSPTCWESPQYVPPIPLGCLPPHAVESRRLSRPFLRQDPSSPSLPVVAAVPPSTPPAPSCCPDVNRDEGELLHDDPPQPAPISQLYNSDICEEDETLLEDKEEDGSIGGVENIIASFNVAQMSSTDVENCGFKRGGACTGVRTIAYIHVDFFDGDVPCTVHRSTSLDVDARFIPQRNDTPYLSILGGDKGRHSVVRYVFDPGGDALLKLLLSTLVNGSWFPP